MIKHSLTIDVDNLEDRLNDDQCSAYKTILNVVTNKEGKLFFVYGSGGTNKTFGWTMFLSRLRGQGKIMLALHQELHLCCFWATKSPIQDSRFQLICIMN